MAESHRELLYQVALDPSPHLELRTLPETVVELLDKADAPLRLVAHLRAVHEVACELVASFHASWPSVVFKADEVRFGAATHDIGKARHRNELDGPGSMHEEAGQRFLLETGVSPQLAPFAAQHAKWDAADIECQLVELADKAWKGKRQKDLEDLLIDEISRCSRQERWEAFMQLDDLLVRITAASDARLAFQNQYPT